MSSHLLGTPLTADLFNPTVGERACEKHGSTEHFNLKLDGISGECCIKCWNNYQRAHHEAMCEAMIKAGHSVEKLDFVVREVV